MDINKIAKEKYPDIDMRLFADKDGFIRDGNPYWEMHDKRTSQRLAWIEGVKWCARQNASNDSSALPIADVGKQRELLIAFAEKYAEKRRTVGQNCMNAEWFVDDFLKGNL